MLTLAIYALPALCALLPNWLAAALVPGLLVLQRLSITEEEIVKVGPASIYPLDILTMLLLAKWVLALKLPLQPIRHRGVYGALGAWAVVNLVASVCAGLKFGEAHMIGCLVSCARGLAEAVVVLILAHSIGSLRQARAVIIALLVFLGALAAIQFVNFFGAGSGIVIGEVQGLERGQPRYFGPVGDSVGFVLLLGYLYWLCRMNIVGAAMFAGGILLTAGLGAILGLVVATGLRLMARRQLVPPSGAGWRAVQMLAFLAVAVAGINYAEAMTETLRERLSGEHEESSGQRQATTTVAVAMIGDNIFSGVGFMGFRLAVGRYGGEEFFELDKPDGATANANNQVLQSLTDAGLAGLICLGALVLTAARLFYRVATRVEDPFLQVYFWAAMLWLLAQVFGNLVATWLTPSSFVALLLWISIGLALGVERLLPSHPTLSPIGWGRG
jgi:hypothetical protein